jgi:hypothetical protein
MMTRFISCAVGNKWAVVVEGIVDAVGGIASSYFLAGAAVAAVAADDAENEDVAEFDVCFEIAEKGRGPSDPYLPAPHTANTNMRQECTFREA